MFPEVTLLVFVLKWTSPNLSFPSSDFVNECVGLSMRGSLWCVLSVEDMGIEKILAHPASLLRIY